ncbi:MAG: carbohydrate ABC transporter permease [Armatimonadetes bacterium]|nr:carbohydrate ABC transporter permease [Armatimonadota bacterium]
MDRSALKEVPKTTGVYEFDRDGLVFPGFIRSEEDGIAQFEIIGSSSEAGTVLEVPKDDLRPVKEVSFQFHNFADAISYGEQTLGYKPFLVYARNTILFCILFVGGVVISNSIVAYSFARLRWPGRDLVFALTLATMMIPFPVIMVPLFTLFVKLDWAGTFRPLWVPAWFGSAFSIFLLRQFYKSIPNELSEAAKIDGCSEWGIYYKVILPLTKPALAVVALFAFMSSWNDFLGPLIYLHSQEHFTLSLGLNFYRSQQGAQWHLLMAASTVVLAPVIILFFFTQRLFIQGIAATGLKG